MLLPFFSYTIGQSILRLDTNQNIENTTVDSAKSVFTLRELITADTTAEDIPLNTNRVLIWAMGSISIQSDPMVKSFRVAHTNQLMRFCKCLQCCDYRKVLLYNVVLVLC